MLRGDLVPLVVPRVALGEPEPAVGELEPAAPRPVLAAGEEAPAEGCTARFEA